MTLGDGYDFGRLLAYATPLFVFLLSLMLNVRQFYVWRIERRRAEIAEDLLDMCRKMEQVSRRMYESTEQRQWTVSGVRWKAQLLASHRAGEALSAMVDVTVERPMHPVQLRFWFSTEVSKKPEPVVQIENPGEPQPDKKWTPGDPVRNEPARVSDSGRVDVFIMEKALTTESSLRLLATAASNGPFELLRVERCML